MTPAVEKIESKGAGGLPDRVFIEGGVQKDAGAKRILDLDRIQNPSLRLLAPNESEIAGLKTDRGGALEAYADRLRTSYRENRDDFRAGLAALSESLNRGDRIAVACACRNGEMCHADVVKMAVEKVNSYHKSQALQALTNTTNPRTQRAINEILAVSEHDRLLAGLNQTDGRNRSEQASFLGKTSQFARDVYERGAIVSGGNLIVPAERLEASAPPAITTETFAVQKLARMLGDEAKAKELAPVVVGYAEQIAGASADGESKIKVFSWIYDSLAGRSELVETDSRDAPDFSRTLAGLAGLAAEMKALEPSEPIEIVENRDGGSVSADVYERIELQPRVPQIPRDWSEREIERLLEDTLPEIDRQLENGVAISEILKPFNAAIRESRDESAYRELSEIAVSQKVESKVEKDFRQQFDRIDPTRRNVVEPDSPSQFYAAAEQARNAFYRSKNLEKADLLTRLDEVESRGDVDRKQKTALESRLRKVDEAVPNFAYKLDGSEKIVTGKADPRIIEERNFIASYAAYQLSKPETRLRFESERYRQYAIRLESAPDHDRLLLAASSIRAENAAIGLRWAELPEKEKHEIPRPLSAKELRVLFTEPSPAHYDTAMTAARLAFAHDGASRRSITESLHRGELKPSNEAQLLIESLESRRERRDIRHAIGATRHFIESLRTPPEALRVPNNFDHRQTYQKLPPQEKDYVFQRATHQRENLEYRLAIDELERGVSSGVTEKTANSPVSEIASDPADRFNQILDLREKAVTAASENEKLLTDYAARASAVITDSKAELPPTETRRALTSAAFGNGESKPTTEKSEKTFLNTVRDLATITDFQKYQTNQEIITTAKSAQRGDIPNPVPRANEPESTRAALKSDITKLLQSEPANPQELSSNLKEIVATQIEKSTGVLQSKDTVAAQTIAGKLAERLESSISKSGQTTLNRTLPTVDRVLDDGLLHTNRLSQTSRSR